jgi:NAD(P) transhydrogenase subunit alpha
MSNAAIPKYVAYVHATNELVNMRPLALPIFFAFFLAVSLSVIGVKPAFCRPGFQADSKPDASETNIANIKTNEQAIQHAAPQSSRSLVLVGSLTVFVLSIFVGFEIIAKVPPTLHTPLMSGSNAISGITVVGSIIACGYRESGIGTFFGMIAIVLAMINVVGGFLVTHRMLLMFKKR